MSAGRSRLRVEHAALVSLQHPKAEHVGDVILGPASLHVVQTLAHLLAQLCHVCIIHSDTHAVLPHPLPGPVHHGGHLSAGNVIVRAEGAVGVPGDDPILS